MSTLDDLSSEVAELRAELAALRAQLAGEVRTRRLVVVDEHGEERIRTAVTGDMTILDVTSAPLPDIGFGSPGRATVQIAADGGGSQDGRDTETACATVACSTGDDSYALLGQKQWVTSGGMVIVEGGELELHRQRSRRGPDGTFETAERTSIEVGEDGLTERGPGHQVIAYSPLMKASSRSLSGGGGGRESNPPDGDRPSRPL